MTPQQQTDMNAFTELRDNIILYCKQEDLPHILPLLDNLEEEHQAAFNQSIGDALKVMGKKLEEPALPLAEIMAAANEILEGRRSAFKAGGIYDKWPFNCKWSVSCTNVLGCRDINGKTSIIIELQEGDCRLIESWVLERLQERFPGIVFDVRSEW